MMWKFHTEKKWLSTTMTTNQSVIITKTHVQTAVAFFLFLTCCALVQAYLAIWVTLVSLILNEYMYTSKYTENVLVIIRQDYGI